MAAAPLTVALLLAWGVPAESPVVRWELEIEACAQGRCKRDRIQMPAAWRCDDLKAELIAFVPGSKPKLWGFPKAKDVRVSVDCVEVQGLPGA